jgi:DNA-binding MarR family transcriptional regulator
MKIEQEIQQSKFINEYQKLLINIIYTNNWVTSTSKQFFNDADITMHQFNILRILRGAKETISTLQIRERMLDKMSDTSRIVERLCIKGFAKKAINKLDKRLVCVTITPKGLTLLKSMDSKEMDIINTLRNITEAEAKQLNKLLDKVRGK